tara:strand:- start:1550 stop:2494 length:945 start_codon:yes stop_codon:yes gene_type:complete
MPPTSTSATTAIASAGAAGAVAALGVQSGMADLVDHISGKTAVTLSDIVGGDDNLSKLAKSASDLTSRNGGTIDKLRRANMYDEWLTSSEKLDAQTGTVIYNAREYYKKGPGQASFLTEYAEPDISANIHSIETTIKGFLTDISTNYNTIHELFEVNSYDIIQNVMTMKEKTKHDITGNIGLYTDKVNLDIRKNLYEFESINIFNNIFYILRIVYYVIFAIYIIFGDFMKQQLYKNPYFYLVAILYLIMPFTIKYIYALIIYLYEQVLKLFGIHKPVLSYSDIVRANNIDAIYTAPVPGINQYNKKENEIYKPA